MTRREAIKTALRAGAYAAPAVLSVTVPARVAAASPVPTADIGVQYFFGPGGGGGAFLDGLVTNFGPSAATGVAVSFPIPAGMTATGVVNATQGTYSAATGVWTIGNLAVNAPASIAIAVRYTPPVTVTATATRIASSPTDPNTANDTSTLTGTISS